MNPLLMRETSIKAAKSFLKTFFSKKSEKKNLQQAFCKSFFYCLNTFRQKGKSFSWGLMMELLYNSFLLFAGNNGNMNFQISRIFKSFVFLKLMLGAMSITSCNPIYQIHVILSRASLNHLHLF